MDFISIEERKQVRTNIEYLHKFNLKLENFLRKKMEVPLDVRKRVFELTGCSDMGEAYEALLEIKEYSQEQYLQKLKGMAPKSLSAFAEYMNPDEPPAPHHEFLIDHLEAIEAGDLQRMLLSMPPGHAKPLTLDCPVMLHNGSYKALGDIKVGDSVVTHEGRSRPVTAIHEQGELEVWHVKTASGRVIRCAADHPFLTTRGWIEAQHLDKCDYLINSTIATEGTYHREDHYFLAGALAFNVQPVDDEFNMGRVNYYCDIQSQEVCDELLEVCARLNIEADYAFKVRRGSFPNRVYFGKSSNHDFQKLRLLDTFKTRRVPAWVFNGSHEQIYSFLRGYYRTTFSERRQCKWPDVHRRLGFHLPHEGAAEDIERLYWRIGINAGKTESPYTYENNVKGSNLYAGIIYHCTHAVFLPPQEAAKFRSLLEDNFPWVIKDTPREVWWHKFGDAVVSATNYHYKEEMRCLTVEEDHSFTVHGLVVHNSTYSSHLFPAWYLGRNPKKRYLQAGHTQKFCEDELGKKVRNYIRNERYADIFPEIEIAHDTSAAATWALAKYNGKYMVRAVGQGIAGLRGHIGGVDDPYPTYKEAESPTYRQGVIDWFRADFATRLLPNAPLFVVATRWHMEDLCGILEEDSKKGKIIPYTVINLPVFCVDPSTDPLGRKIGEKLWDFFPDTLLLDFRSSLSTRQFSALYQGNPIPDSGNMLKPEWIRRYSALPKGEKSVTISVDTANKDTERSDFTVITVWYQYNNEHYLIDVIRRRMEYNEIKATIELHARKHNADRILVEDAGTGAQYHIEATKTEHTPPCPVILIKTGGKSKEFRYDAALPQFEAGNVFFPENADWLNTLETELLNFPSVKNDDQVDSVSQYLVYRRPKPTHGSHKMRATAQAGSNRKLTAEEKPDIRPGTIDMSEAEDA